MKKGEAIGYGLWIIVGVIAAFAIGVLGKLFFTAVLAGWNLL